MNDREEESKDALDEKFSRILPIIKLPKGYYQYDLYEPIGDAFNEFYEPEISKSELEAILEAEKWETCYKELETRWKEENEYVILLDEKSFYELPDIKLPKGYYLFDLYEEDVRKAEEPWEYYPDVLEALWEKEISSEFFDFEVRKVEVPWKYYLEVLEALWKNEISNEYYDGLSEAQVKAILEAEKWETCYKEYKEEETRLKEEYEEMVFDFEYSGGFLIEELGDYDLMKYYCEEEAESWNGNSKLCHDGIKYLTQEEYEAQLDRFSDYELLDDDDLSEEQLEDLEKIRVSWEEFLKEEEPWEYYHEVLEAYWIETEPWEYYPEVLETLWKEDYGEVVEPHNDNEGGEGMLNMDSAKLKPLEHCEWDNILKKISTESLSMCKNESQGFCNKNVHDIMVKMGATKSYLYQGGLFDKCSSFLFCWDYIPEKEEQCDHLKKFLRKKYNLDWIVEAKIDKNEWDTVIRVFTQTEKLTIRKKQNKAIVNYLALDGLGDEFDFDNLDTLILKYEDCNLNVYHRKYCKLEGPECIQYLHEYVPLHLPQITCVLSDILTRKIFTDNQTINILDFGSGPATVPLALCRIKENEIKDRKFKITTVEASKTFNNMIQNFKFKNKNKSVHIINNIECDAIDFINKMEFKGGYNWIIIANSITILGEDRSFEEVNIILNKFIFNILNRNKKLGDSNKILITFIESGAQDKFNFKFIDYFSDIENIGFTNLEIIDSIQKNRRIEAKWILDCDFYKTGNNLYMVNINSKSLLLELKK